MPSYSEKINFISEFKETFQDVKSLIGGERYTPNAEIEIHLFLNDYQNEIQNILQKYDSQSTSFLDLAKIIAQIKQEKINKLKSSYSAIFMERQIADLAKIIDKMHVKFDNEISKRQKIELSLNEIDTKINHLLKDNFQRSSTDQRNINQLHDLIEERLTISNKIEDLHYTNNYTLLHLAAKYNWLDIAERVYKINPISINQQIMYDEYTPLQIAASKGHKEVLGFLINQTYDDKVNSYGESLIHAAVKNGSSDIIDLLHSNGVRITTSELRATALSIALDRGHLEIAKSLIEAMQLNELENSKYAQSILLSLTNFYNIDSLESSPTLRENIKSILNSLIGKGLKIDGHEEVIYHLGNDKAELVRIFFEAGLGMPKENVAHFNGMAANGEDKILAVIIDNLSRINKIELEKRLAQKDNDGMTAMHHALGQSRDTFIIMLLEFQLGNEKAQAKMDQYKKLQEKIKIIFRNLDKLPTTENQPIKKAVLENFKELQEQMFFGYQITKEFNLSTNPIYMTLLEMENAICQPKTQHRKEEDLILSSNGMLNDSKPSKSHQEIDHSFILKVVIGIILPPIGIALLLKGIYNKIVDPHKQYKEKQVQSLFFKEKMRLAEENKKNCISSPLRLSIDTSKVSPNF